MAIKGDRIINSTVPFFSAPEAVEAGQMLVYKTSQASGHAVGQGINSMSPQAVPLGTGTVPSGTKVAGLALANVVNIYNYALAADGTSASGAVLTAGIGDPTLMKYHRNDHKTDQIVGENVNLLTDGVVWINNITGTPAAGDIAYVAASSNLSNTQASSVPAVGKFLTAKDTNGYALVSIKIA